MRRSTSQTLLKFEVEQKSVSESSVFLKERVKILIRCFILMTLVSFLVLFYAPVYFQVTFGKKPVDASVLGWGLNASRFIPLYIQPDNDTALIVNSQLCSKPLPLLIIVCSAVNNFDERLAIRETWGNFSSPSYKVAFLLGTTENETMQFRVDEESQLYNDIIQEDFIDSYNNLTLKSVMLLKYVKNHCDKVSYVLKSDDDMFVHVQNLLGLVNKYIKNKDKQVLVGELIRKAKPIHNRRSKWYTPKYMFKERFYPRYLSGTGYLMDRSTAIALYEAALTTPFFHLEDVYITGLCARKVNITPRHHMGFSYLTRPLDPCLYIQNKDVFTSHRVSLVNMRQLWAGLHNGTICPSPAPTSKPKPTSTKLKYSVPKSNGFF